MTWCYLVWRICARGIHTRVSAVPDYCSLPPSPPLPYEACAAANDSRRGCFRCAWSPCRCCPRRYCRAAARLPTSRPREPSSIGEIGPRQHRDARRTKPERATIGLIGVAKGEGETAASSLAWPQHLNSKSPPSLLGPVVRVFRVCVPSCSRRLLTNPSRKLRIVEATKFRVLRGVVNCIG